MREGTAILAISLLFGCASPEPSPKIEEKTKKTETEPKTQKNDLPVEKVDPTADLPKIGIEKSRLPSEDSVKGDGASPNAEAKSSGADAIVRLLRERMARDPSNDLEKEQLALHLLTLGDLPEAEQLLSSVRRKSDLFPYVEAYLYRKLGEAQRAAHLHDELFDEWKRADGFRIERADLVTSAPRYLHFTPHPDGKLQAGAIAKIYVQPRNFTLLRDGATHVLHLTYDWKLFDDRDREIRVPVWEQLAQSDRSDLIKYRGPVSEFYQVFRLPLPSNLAAGNYRIQVIVTDQGSKREDRAFVPFTVAPK